MAEAGGNKFLLMRAINKDMESTQRMKAGNSVIPTLDEQLPDFDVSLGKLPSYLGYQLRQAQAVLLRKFAQNISDIGVTHGEFSLLTLVHENPGIHQKGLLRVFPIDKSTLSNSIKELTHRELIHRIRDRKDGRYYGLWLSETGTTALERATQLVEEQEDIIESVLASGERDMLLGLLVRLTWAFD